MACIVVFAGIFILDSFNPSLAQDFHVTAGFKAWYPRWDVKIGGETLSTDFDWIGMPSFGVRWGKFFGGLNIASGTVVFPEDRTVRIESSTGGTITRVEGKIDFIQLETGIGYYIAPWFGPYIGVLSQRQDYEIKSFDKPALNVKGDQTLNKPLIGFLVNGPAISVQTSTFANVAVVGLGSKDIFGWMFEAGLAYVAQAVPVSFSIGFKSQILDYEEDVLILNDNPRKRDILLGLILGAHYTF